MTDPARTVVTRLEAPVAWIEMNDPSRKNALTQEIVAGLEAAFDEVARDPDIRVVVLAGAGADFCAGGDISCFDLSVAGGRDYVYDVVALFRRIEHFRKPVVAAVRGRALGGGFELVTACDCAVAVSDSTFALPEVTVGAIPAYAMRRLPELIGRGRAWRSIMLAEPMSAEQAHLLGLVTELVADDMLESAVMHLAHRLAAVPRVAAELLKAGINSDVADRTLFETTTAAAVVWGTDAIREGRAAFFERRSPSFPRE